MTDPPEAVPDALLDGRRPLGAAFTALGCVDLRAAARYVADLPYGRTSGRADYRLVLSERRGACSTKHALVAAPAAEVGAAVELRLGLYEMTEADTPGVGTALAAAGLDAVPEAHVWIRTGGHDRDLTWPGRAAVPPRCSPAETIQPDQIGAYKVAWHRHALRAWAVQ